ncbi:MAG TPA: diguanylate cyclase [Sulfuricurvum sp.]|nr:diguanylate cyclase [Sulfuricurvum sp.]
MRSASFGLTICRYEDDKNRTFKRADEALYKAKTHGGNRDEVEL